MIERAGIMRFFSFIDEETAKAALDEADKFLTETKSYLGKIGISVV